MSIPNETKIFLGIFLATLLIIIGGVWITSRPAPQVDTKDVLTESAMKTGSESAKVTLVEFSDFQCPACKAFQPAVEEIIRTYPNEVLVAYRHFPLHQHPFAVLAAETAEAAGAQGKFWEMTSYLFLNQERISEDFLKNSWKDVKLDEKKFTEALTKHTYRAKIDQDTIDGKRLGVSGTPTFFLNGRKLLLRSTQDLITEVEKEIQATK